MFSSTVLFLYPVLCIRFSECLISTGGVFVSFIPLANSWGGGMCSRRIFLLYRIYSVQRTDDQ